MLLQRFGQFDGARPIAVGLDHAHHLGAGFQERTPVIQVVDHSREVHFQNGLMNFLLQQFRDAFKAEAT